jgi:exopolysaccharide biosynthesis polyprenyl glycosylphosphotransferase
MQILDFLQKKHRLSGHPHHRGGNKDGLVDRYNGLYQEPYFCELLSIERKRSERSRKPFLLLLIDFQDFEEGFDRHQIAKKVGDILSPVTRDTDFKGWHQHGNVLGVIFTELAVKEKNLKTAQKHLAGKCWSALEAGLDETEIEKIIVTWHIFPGQFDKFITDELTHTKVYPDVLARMAKKRGAHLVKRIIDILGSICALVFFSPLFLAIAFLIKLSSNGPVFFKQERVGLLGKKFMFLKFRSMFKDNDPTIHKEFVKNLICGEQNRAGGKEGSNQECAYKITRDPRVTPIGEFLRKTSLDELPQFINVLKGEMSLVGPRPPIPYECAEYDVWHRRRVLEMKPGITGLWQVRGRSRTTFDEMVRMDIQYIQNWSIWLDIKILIQTPLAVFSGKGAY